MSEAELKDLTPALLVFASVGFAVFFSVPILRLQLLRSHDKVEARVTKDGSVPLFEWASAAFYLIAASFSSYISFPYMLSAVFILAIPLGLSPKVAYWVILLTTSAFLSLVIGGATRTTYAARKRMKIGPA